MHFGENQLSQSLIGLSPLPTAHPPSFQPRWVRASTRSYTRFTLAMGRSLRFGSRPSNYIALFRLAFATAAPHGLTSLLSTNSQAHSSKGTPSHQKTDALTDCKHMVSGTLSLPSRGTFHHSLTVLIHYRSIGSIQAYQVVLADSHTIPRAACYSRTHHRPAERINNYGTHTLYGKGLNPFRLYARTSTPRDGGPWTDGLTTPTTQPPPGITRHWFSPIRFRSPLLTQSLLFSLPAGTEMFHFPTFLPHRLYIQRPVTHHNSMPGSPIRKSWPQHSVISSTRLIADSHVLHQLLLPRHPPCALKHLQHNTDTHPPNPQKNLRGKTKNKMLASTMQFPNNNPHPHHHSTPPQKKRMPTPRRPEARTRSTKPQ